MNVKSQIVRSEVECRDVNFLYDGARIPQNEICEQTGASYRSIIRAMAKIKRYGILVILILTGMVAAHAQVRRAELFVEFRVNNSDLDSTFSDNAKQLDEIVKFIDYINQDSTLILVELSFCGSASPEGSSQLNYYLANKRLKALERYVRSHVYVPDSIITYDDSFIPWDRFRKQVQNMELKQKQEVLDIIDKECVYVKYHGNTHIDHRVVELMELDGGDAWRQLHTMFDELRSAYAVFTTVKLTPMLTIPELQAEDGVCSIDTVRPHAIPLASTPDYGYRHLHLSTNLPLWGLLISNATVEVDLSRHWSLALPVYYSALDYFADDVKFRTVTLQPELRYWFRGCESSWYVGGHMGISYYNIAWGDLFRYQDHNMDTPAIGGGLSIGYRMPLGESKRWCLDASVGAGVYDVHYDRFINIHNGFLVDSNRMTYAGVDHAALSLSYMFNLAKRKKR